MKKLISILMAIIMMITCTISAFSAELQPYSYLDTDFIYREYENSESKDVYLLPGEYINVDSFHGIASSLYSYENIKVVSSNPEVATASVPKPTHTYQYLFNKSGAMSSNILDSYLGIRIRGKQCGYTEITVTYSTEITLQARLDNIRDSRGVNTFTKVFHVHVVNKKLEIEAEWADVANGTPKQITVAWGNPSTETNYGTSAAIAAGVAATDVAVGNYLDKKVEVEGKINKSSNANEIKKGYNKGKNSLKKSLGKMAKGATKILGRSVAAKVVGGIAGGAAIWVGSAPLATAAGVILVAETIIDVGAFAVDVIRSKSEENLAKNIEIPLCLPSSVQLNVRIKNKSDENVSGVNVKLETHEFSLTGKDGPWADSMNIGMGNIAANTTSSTNAYTIYPKVAYHSSDSMKGEIIYNGTVRIYCTYYDKDLGKEITIYKDVLRSVRGDLSNSDKEKYQELKKSYDSKFFLMNVLCPVEILILNQNGNEVAVIQSDSEEVFDEEGIFACADGDSKSLILSEEATENYQIKIRAVGEGTMSINSMQYEEESCTAGNGFVEIEIAQGDLFEVGFSEEGSSRLFQVGKDETKTELAAAYMFNRETLAEELKTTDISEDSIEPVVEALVHGIAVEGLMKNFQSETTIEEFALGMMRIYENYYGLDVDSLMESYLEQLAEDDEEENTVIGAAVFHGILPEKFQEIARDEAAETVPLRKIDAATVINRFLEKSGVQGNVATELEWTDISAEIYTEEEIESANIAYTMDFLGGSIDQGTSFSPEDTLTHEQCMVLLYQVWKHCKVATERNSFIISAQEQMINQMTSFESSALNLGLTSRYLEEERKSTALGDFSLYFPSYAMWSLDTVDSRQLIDDVITCEMAIIQNGDELWGKEPVATERIRTELNEYTIFSEASMLFEDGTKMYRSIPFAYENTDGMIVDDVVYLLIVSSQVGCDEKYYETHDAVRRIGPARMEATVVADEEIVTEYLELMRSTLMCSKTEATEVNYTELSQGSKGSEVQILQQALIDQGYLSGVADGDYGGMTAQAISDFQAAMGLEVTGIADSKTQSLLCPKTDDTQMLLNWLDARKES